MYEVAGGYVSIADGEEVFPCARIKPALQVAGTTTPLRSIAQIILTLPAEVVIALPGDQARRINRPVIIRLEPDRCAERCCNSNRRIAPMTH